MSTRPRSSSPSAGRSTSGGSRRRPRRTSSGSSTNTPAGMPSSAITGSGMPSCPPRARSTILFNGDVGYVYPHRCWSCMVPCLIREDFVYDEVDGKIYTYCSEICRWTAQDGVSAEYQGRPTPAMGRFSGRREWETCYHGWDCGRRDQGPGLRPCRRQDPGAAAAPDLRRQEDVDAGPHARRQAGQPAARLSASCPRKRAKPRPRNTARATRSRRCN